jgi:uncharacterized protein (TIGR03905 family)
MRVELDDQNIIRDFSVYGGCSGNLQAVSILVRGMPAEEAITKLKGIRCGYKPTSCPDQLARGLERALKKQREEGSKQPT